MVAPSRFQQGAALSLYMVFSLAPMLILVIAVAGAFFGEEAVRSELFSQVRDLTGERGAEVIQTVLASAHESGSGWLAALLSICVLVFSATTAFAELKASLDELWDVKEDKTVCRGWCAAACCHSAWCWCWRCSCCFR